MQIVQGTNHSVDVAMLVGLPMCGRFVAGRVMLVARYSGRIAFFCTITRSAIPDAGVTLVGEKAGLDDSKAALRAASDRHQLGASDPSFTLD